MDTLDRKALDQAVELTKCALSSSTRDQGCFVIDKPEATAAFLETVYNKILDIQNAKRG